MNNMNKQELAEKYAKRYSFDVCKHVADKEEWSYYHLNWNPRPHYTGHPNVIKINDAGTVKIVTNITEIYWAIRQRKK